MSPQGSPSEVDAYVFIKNTLKSLGWDTRNPDRVPDGQVWTQNECLGNPEIKRHLGLGRPENIAKVSDSILWVIEAKRSLEGLGDALDDAYGRAEVLNKSERLKVKFVSGVAGNQTDGFITRTEYLRDGVFQPVTWNDEPVTGLLRHADMLRVLEYDSPDVGTPKIDEALFLARATAINEQLHLGGGKPPSTRKCHGSFAAVHAN